MALNPWQMQQMQQMQPQMQPQMLPMSAQQMQMMNSAGGNDGTFMGALQQMANALNIRNWSDRGQDAPQQGQTGGFGQAAMQGGLADELLPMGGFAPQQGQGIEGNKVSNILNGFMGFRR